MSRSERAQDAIETLLKAYVSSKAGDNRRAANIFAQLNKSNPTGVGIIMEGLAKSLLALKEEEELEDTLLDNDLEDMEDMDDNLEDMDEDMDMGDDLEDPRQILSLYNKRMVSSGLEGVLNILEYILTVVVYE